MTSYFDEIALPLSFKVEENLTFLLPQFVGIFLHLFVSAHIEFIKDSELWINYGRVVVIRYVVYYSSFIQQVFVEYLLCVRHPGP